MTAPTNEAEARAQLADAKRELDGLVATTRAKFNRQAAAVRERLAWSDARRDHWQLMVDELAPHEAHPEGGFLRGSARLMRDMYVAMRRMLEVELATHEANLKLLEFDTPPGPIPFREATEQTAFHEARLRVDAALAPFLWRASIDGIDATFRALGRPPARDHDASAREARAAAVREEASGDLAFDRLLQDLGAELEGFRAPLAWAETAFDGFEQLDAGAKRALLTDPRWATVAEATEKLQRLHARTASYPVLGRHFPKPQPVDLPFAPVEDAAGTKGPATKGPDQVQLSQGRASSFKLGDLPGGKPAR